MDPEQIALDTSVLCRPYDRRFVMAAWQLLGAKVAILPRVAQQDVDPPRAHQLLVKGKGGAERRPRLRSG